MELFKWRFMNHPAEDRDGWLHRNNLKYQSARRALARAHPSRFAPWPSVCRAWQISREEYDSLRAELQQTMAARREDAEKITSERIEHYKVHAPAHPFSPPVAAGPCWREPMHACSAIPMRVLTATAARLASACSCRSHFAGAV